MYENNIDLEKKLRTEFATLMAGLKSNYPNWQFDLQDKNMMLFWYESLMDIPMQVLTAAVHKLISQEEFYPNIAKIRKAASEIINGEPIDETEAWGLVKKAIRSFGYARAEEAYASLPVEVVQAIQAMGGWLEICSSENDEADRAHFYKTMKSINKRQELDNVVSIGLKNQISLLQKPKEPIAYIPNETRYERASDESINRGLEKVRSILASLGTGA